MPSRAGARPSGLMPTRRRLAPLAELVLHAPAPGKPPSRAAALLDRPGKARLDRARRLVDVVAVQAQTRPPAATSCGRRGRSAARRPAPAAARQVRRRRRRQRKSRSRPRRYSPSARRGSRNRRRGRWRPLMKASARRDVRQLCHHVLAAAGPASASSARSGTASSRTLAGQTLRRCARSPPPCAAAFTTSIRRPSSAADAGARHHQVVDDAAVIVEQLRVALLARREIGDDRPGPAPPARRPWWRDRDRRDNAWPICETSNSPALLARVQMLLEDAERILHRHLVAGERHHLGAERHVQRVERRALAGLLGGWLRRSCSSRVPRGLHPARTSARDASPLCRGT